MGSNCNQYGGVVESIFLEYTSHLGVVTEDVNFKKTSAMVTLETYLLFLFVS